MYTQEYTFRAWDRLKKRMLDWSECQKYYFDHLFQSKRYVMMESVGYRDRYFISIYEFDIVQNQNGHIGIILRFEGDFVIKWKKERQGFRHGQTELLNRQTAEKIMVIRHRYSKITTID